MSRIQMALWPWSWIKRFDPSWVMTSFPVWQSTSWNRPRNMVIIHSYPVQELYVKASLHNSCLQCEVCRRNIVPGFTEFWNSEVFSEISGKKICIICKNILCRVSLSTIIVSQTTRTEACFGTLKMSVVHAMYDIWLNENVSQLLFTHKLFYRYLFSDIA